MLVECRKKLRRLLVRFPALALIGFFPPIYVIGAAINIGGILKYLITNGIHDLGDTMALVSIIFVPVWPLMMYRSLLEDKELRNT